MDPRNLAESKRVGLLTVMGRTSKTRMGGRPHVEEVGIKGSSTSGKENNWGRSWILQTQGKQVQRGTSKGNGRKGGGGSWVGGKNDPHSAAGKTKTRIEGVRLFKPQRLCPA